MYYWYFGTVYSVNSKWEAYVTIHASQAVQSFNPIACIGLQKEKAGWNNID